MGKPPKRRRGQPSVRRGYKWSDSSDSDVEMGGGGREREADVRGTRRSRRSNKGETNPVFQCRCVFESIPLSPPFPLNSFHLPSPFLCPLSSFALPLLLSPFLPPSSFLLLSFLLSSPFLPPLFPLSSPFPPLLLTPFPLFLCVLLISLPLPLPQVTVSPGRTTVRVIAHRLH